MMPGRYLAPDYLMENLKGAEPKLMFSEMSRSMEPAAGRSEEQPNTNKPEPATAPDAMMPLMKALLDDLTLSTDDAVFPPSSCAGPTTG